MFEYMFEVQTFKFKYRDEKYYINFLDITSIYT